MATPLLMALYQGRTDDAVRMAQHTNVTLPEAAALGDGSACGALLDTGADINTCSPDGWSSLHLAAFFGHAPVVELLLSRGAAVGAMATSAQGNTALHAALAGHADDATVAALLRADADVNAPDTHQVRPIHLAASRGNLSALESLVARGARIDLPLPDGTHAADLARKRGHAVAAAWLDRQTKHMEAR